MMTCLLSLFDSTLRKNDFLSSFLFYIYSHEDLRQDERVIQLFGLVNALLDRDRQKRMEKIQRYAVCPLSHNCGLVGWVPQTATLHALIRDYRQSKRIPLNLEHREMLKISPNYDELTVMQKVEVFTDALKKTTGQGNDLYEILWLKSTNSEEWLDRRTRYTRSLAVMSMVGYILGLGDRHPSNIMLDKTSGKLLQIDFGDCFEVAMNREKFPETVGFRLTRMLIKAMEVSGIEGSYRSTCERTMTILRENRDSLVAMLEAFVYDPLMSWRLVDISDDMQNGRTGVQSSARSGVNPLSESLGVGDVDSGVPINGSLDMSGRSFGVVPISEGENEDDDVDPDNDDRDKFDNESDGIFSRELGRRHQTSSIPIQSNRHSAREAAISASRARSLQMYANIQTWAANTADDGQLAASGSVARSRMERSMRQRELLSLLDGENSDAAEEALNEKALKVIRRVQDKLSGTDFPDRDENGDPLAVEDQVQRLIVQATSVENLCQLFIGWCAFW
jgi:phosphatidylinositol kinase/protein kinase (PI-3  family)